MVGDPKAADIVFTCEVYIIAVGINVTHQVIATEKMLSKPKDLLTAEKVFHTFPLLYLL